MGWLTLWCMFSSLPLQIHLSSLGHDSVSSWMGAWDNSLRTDPSGVNREGYRELGSTAPLRSCSLCDASPRQPFWDLEPPVFVSHTCLSGHSSAGLSVAIGRQRAPQKQGYTEVILEVTFQVSPLLILACDYSTPAEMLVYHSSAATASLLQGSEKEFRLDSSFSTCGGTALDTGQLITSVFFRPFSWSILVQWPPPPNGLTAFGL